jgi:hypothetical protein
MLRVFLTILLPLLAPMAIYFAWVWLSRRKAAAGEDAWKDAPWVWLAGGGILLAAAVMAYLYVTTGHPPGTKFAPPALIDGKVVPSHPVE